MINDISHGRRPLRPTDPNQNQWLHDSVWDTITTCWKNEPACRYELSVVYEIFSRSRPYDTQNAKSDKPGNLNVQSRKNPTIAERTHVGTGQQQRANLLPRIASLLCLRDSEPEIERLVNEMDKGGPPLPPSSDPMANMSCSVSRVIPSRIGNA